MQCLNDLCKKHTSTVSPVFKEIIFQLHSENEEIRVCALDQIFDLVSQDFIKMKGRVLFNFLACLVDKYMLIQLKSQAAILNYVNEKNPNLLYTCFVESVFLFNDFIHPENSFSVFPFEEIDRNHLLLHGNDNRKRRYELYIFLLQNMNEIHSLMLLKQLIVLNEKLEKNIYKKSQQGIDTFKDLMHIFQLVCEKKEESKLDVNKTENLEYANGDDHEDIYETLNPVEQKHSKNKKNTLTVNDVVPMIEKFIAVYPSFYNNMISYDILLENDLIMLTNCIALNFGSFIKYSKDESFWKPKRRRKIEG